MKQKYMLTRQRYWIADADPTDPIETNLVVEIALGGWDYSNPDAFCRRYVGEMEEYTDPREVAQAAIEIQKLWQADLDKEGEGHKCRIDYGCTYGDTLYFDEAQTPEALLKWAEEQYQKLDKCDRCGELIGHESYTHVLNFDEEKFCSENCAEAAYFEMCVPIEEDEETEEEEDAAYSAA